MRLSVGLAIVVWALVGFAGTRHPAATARLQAQAAAGYAVDWDMPDPKMTPGWIDLGLTKDVLCAPDFRTSTVRSVSAKTRRAVFAEYGIDSAYSSEYEVDHLVSLEIGGSNDLKNLWPEHYSNPWGARVKDRLENALHKEVCAGVISLADAQRIEAGNWKAAYRARFGN